MELALFDFDHTVTTCDTYGRFLRRVATAEQLAQVDGNGLKTVEKNREMIVVGGAAAPAVPVVRL